MRRLRASLPAALRTFISEYDAGLDESITRDPRYEFRLRIVQELAAKDPDALAVQFTRYDDLDEISVPPSQRSARRVMSLSGNASAASSGMGS